MRVRTLGLLALGSAASIDAFRNTSPFFFFSTHEFESSSRQIESATIVSNDVDKNLLSCPSDFYIIASQPGVHAFDYSSRKSAPRLRERVLKKDSTVKSSYTVSEVVGDIDTTGLISKLESKCGAETITVNGDSGSIPTISRRPHPQIIKVEFPLLPEDSSRAETLTAYDFSLATIIDHLPLPNYTVVYSTNARSQGVEREGLRTQDPLHLQPRSTPDSPDQKPYDSRPLFEKYQFLSPGLFMGLMVVLLFLPLIYIGISGLASVQISYAAFDKANGPAATTSKKQ